MVVLSFFFAVDVDKPGKESTSQRSSFFLTATGPPLVPTATLQDEKASVRKNAVPALEALLGFSPAFSGVAVEGVRGGATSAHAAELSLLQERCNDVSLSTRKVRL